MTGEILAAVALLAALPPTVCFIRNLRHYRRPGDRGGSRSDRADDARSRRLPPVSVLIPARNEEATIGGAVEAALRDQGVDLEVVVLDDHSEDRTAAIVGEVAALHGNVRLAKAHPLPNGWCGKQHACWALAREARNEILVFVDSDVRLEPRACARMAEHIESSGASLASGIPRQQVVTFLEKLLVPLIHFLLLAFLPIWRMRRSKLPAYGAGCGQLFVARRKDYEAAGGHAAIRATLHDGIKLPRAFRAAGFATDLFDATGVATCRMYHGARQVWGGLAKNATEGLAAPRLILPATAILVAGQVLPFALLSCAPILSPAAIALAAAGAAVSLTPRLASIRRFHQPIVGAILHPVGILVLLAIQWHAFARHLSGRPVSWRGRSYAESSEGASSEEAAAGLLSSRGSGCEHRPGGWE